MAFKLFPVTETKSHPALLRMLPLSKKLHMLQKEASPAPQDASTSLD